MARPKVALAAAPRPSTLAERDGAAQQRPADPRHIGRAGHQQGPEQTGRGLQQQPDAQRAHRHVDPAAGHEPLTAASPARRPPVSALARHEGHVHAGQGDDAGDEEEVEPERAGRGERGHGEEVL